MSEQQKNSLSTATPLILQPATLQAADQKLLTRPFGEFLAHTYPPAELIMEPWLPARGLVMIAGYRGIGKTFFATTVAHTIATGGNFIGFPVPVPRKVLYVDGEMDAAELQTRLAAIHRTAERDRNGDPSLALSNLRILTHADQPLGLPDLADPERNGRSLVEAALADADVLFLDNLSALYRTGSENEAESWIVMQEWLISLRRAGKTVVLVHHTGKIDKDGNVSQRGTSKREDALNTSILLVNPRKNGRPGEFMVSFTKARGFVPPERFMVRMEMREGFCEWSRVHPDIEDEISERLKAGMSQKDIAVALRVSEATVSRRKPKDDVQAEPSLSEPAGSGDGAAPDEPTFH